MRPGAEVAGGRRLPKGVNGGRIALDSLTSATDACEARKPNGEGEKNVLNSDDTAFVREAVRYLERPSLAVRLANVVGRPVEAVTGLLPKSVHDIVHMALEKTVDTALRSIPAVRSPSVNPEWRRAASVLGWRHVAATTGTGMAGGLLGLPGLAVELPITTGLMYRSIAVVARECGEDLSLAQTRLECMAVLSKGGPSKDDDAMESTYFATRIAMSRMVGDASRHLVTLSARELADATVRLSSPALVRLISAVASRFNITVGQKVVAQAVPVMGALGGGAVNAAFTDHFNRVARYHFGLRRLERMNGEEAVAAVYDRALEQLNG